MLTHRKSKSFIKKTLNQVDLALLHTYTGVSGYPNCYLNLSHEQKMQESKRISKERMELLKKTAEKLEPKLIIVILQRVSLLLEGRTITSIKIDDIFSIKDVADYFKKDKSLKDSNSLKYKNIIL